MTRELLPTLIAASLAAACAQDLTVHIRGGDRPPDPGYLVLDTGVEVDRFQVIMRNLRMQSEPTDGGYDTPGAAYVGPGPYLVDLTGSDLSGGAFTKLVDDFAVGAHGFYEMNINLMPVSDGDVSLNPSLAPMLGKTFVITGHDKNNAPFTFTSNMTTVLVRDEVFRMGMNHNNVDINIAPNTWFALPDGGVLDPNDPAAAQQIEANVAASIDAYEDDNMDGAPDPLG
jgi:hypothetical protein